MNIKLKVLQQQGSSDRIGWFKFFKIFSHSAPGTTTIISSGEKQTGRKMKKKQKTLTLAYSILLLKTTQNMNNFPDEHDSDILIASRAGGTRSRSKQSTFTIPEKENSKLMVQQIN